MDVRKKETLKSNGQAISNIVKIKIVKNKLAPPFKETEVEIVFGKGFNKVAEILDLSIENGNVIKSGAWFSLLDGTKLGKVLKMQKNILTSI